MKFIVFYDYIFFFTTGIAKKYFNLVVVKFSHFFYLFTYLEIIYEIFSSSYGFLNKKIYLFSLNYLDFFCFFLSQITKKK